MSGTENILTEMSKTLKEIRDNQKEDVQMKKEISKSLKELVKINKETVELEKQRVKDLDKIEVKALGAVDKEFQEFMQKSGKFMDRELENMPTKEEQNQILKMMGIKPEVELDNIDGIEESDNEELVKNG